jgi:DNA-binding transcriptional LysR family regulator
MELRQLRYFLAVAENLHFTRAAERLRVAQPPLSRQIRRLEDELGVQLFRRTRRRVELTQAGALLVPEATKILKQAEHTARVAQGAMRGEIGLLHIGATSSLPFTDLLPKVLSAYRKMFPDVQLVLRELNTKQQLDALHAGDIDLGFVRLPVRILPSRIAVQTVRTEPVVAVLPKGHRLAAARRLDLRLLAEETFIMYPYELGGGLHDLLIRLFNEAGFVPRVQQEATTVPTAVSLAAAGLGIALVPQSIRAVQIPGVVYKPLASPAAKAEIAIAHRLNDRSPAVLAFAKLCRTLRN